MPKKKVHRVHEKTHENAQVQKEVSVKKEKVVVKKTAVPKHKILGDADRKSVV
jgi:hypothetical protein